MNINAVAQAVLDRIDVDELVKVALDLGNIDSPTGSEGPVGEYVHDWLGRQGFAPKKVALFPNRPNVLATLPGSQHGRSLVFNSHMDTTIHKDEIWTTRRAADPVFHSAWREGDVLVGNGICNDKGPMATWLLAAKAIKDSGVTLKGDLVLMAVVGEIGLEPVDEFQPPAYVAKEAGTRYAITHGGVGDFALVAEGTDFGLVGVEAGKPSSRSPSSATTCRSTRRTSSVRPRSRRTRAPSCGWRRSSNASRSGPTRTSNATVTSAQGASSSRA